MLSRFTNHYYHQRLVILSARAFLKTSPTITSEAEFHSVVEGTFERLVDIFTQVEERYDELEYNYSQGVLSVTIGNNGTWVVNKQTPNRQIWWSSPISGPLRFDYQPIIDSLISDSSKVDLLDCWRCPLISKLKGLTLREAIGSEIKMAINIDISSLKG